MRALVTGATGFIGSALVRMLQAEGADVGCFVRNGSTHKPFTHVTYIEDCDSTEELTNRFSAFKPNVVFHLAACQDLSNSLEGARELIQTNLILGSRVLAAAKDSKVKSFISAGTFSSHATGNAEYVPQTFYASTKIAFAGLSETYQTETEMQTLVLELSDTYGPNDPRKKFLNLIWEISHNGQTIDATPGEQKIRPLHVDDVVDGFLFAAKIHLSGGKLASVLSLAGSEEVNLKELVSIFESATGRKVNINWGERPYRENEIMQPYVGDLIPGWQPKIDLKNGLAAVFSN